MINRDPGFFNHKQPRNAEGSNGPRPLPDAAHYWPFGVEMARRSLDPDLIEEHARQVLCQAMISGRLVVFAGAGVTMAYGRMTWGQLLESFYIQLSKSTELQSTHFDFWQRLTKQLWPKGRLDFYENKYDYTIIAQLFDVDQTPAMVRPGPFDAKRKRRCLVARQLGSSTRFSLTGRRQREANAVSGVNERRPNGRPYHA